MEDVLKSRLAVATVRLAKRGDRGVLVRGGFILTAAHRAELPGIETVETRDGRTFRVQLWAADPVADLAALGALDAQAGPEDSLAFERFCIEVRGVALRLETLKVGQTLRGWILSRGDEWVGCRAECLRGHGSLELKAEARLEPGDAGSPVVDRGGLLIGIVSRTSESAGEGVSMPMPAAALPAWLVTLSRNDTG